MFEDWHNHCSSYLSRFATQRPTSLSRAKLGSQLHVLSSYPAIAGENRYLKINFLHY